MRLSPASLLLCIGTAHSFRSKGTKRTCGAKGLSSQIVNGEDASQCEWTWQIGLTNSAGDALPFCGGMLISEEWVLTAAHCVKTPNFYVVAGDWKPKTRSAEKQKIFAAEVYQHPSYNSRTMKFDYALVKVVKPFTMTACVSTVCLPDEEQVVKPGSTCWITGWGTLKSGGSQPDTLQEAPVEIISGSDCVNKFAYKANEIDNATMICAQGKDKDGNIMDACQGDSGGPLVCQEGGTWFIHGATSWGYGCAGSTYPGIWARVTTVRTWIDEVMSGTYSPPPTPAPPACRRRWFC